MHRPKPHDVRRWRIGRVTVYFGQLVKRAVQIGENREPPPIPALRRAGQEGDPVGGHVGVGAVQIRGVHDRPGHAETVQRFIRRGVVTRNGELDEVDHATAEQTQPDKLTVQQIASCLAALGAVVLGGRGNADGPGHGLGVGIRKAGQGFKA